MNGDVFSSDPSEGVIFLSLNPAYKPVTRLFADWVRSDHWLGKVE